VALDRREYSLGSDDSCDLVLADGSVAPRHALILLQDGFARLQAVEGEILLGDTRVTAGKAVEVPHGTLIGFGTTFAGIGPEDTDWLKLVLPDLGAGSNAAESLEEADEGGLGPDSPLQSEEGEDPVAAASAPQTVFGPSAPHSTPRRGFFVLGFTALALLGSILMLVWLRPDLWQHWLAVAQSETTAATDSPLSRARAAMAKAGLDELDLSSGVGGRVVVRGYAASEAAKQRVSSLLEDAGVVVDNRIWAEDWQQRSIRETLNRMGGGPLEMTYLGKGVVRLAGYFPGDLASEEVLMILRNDVPGISRIDSTVTTLADGVADLRERVRDAGLDEVLLIEPDGSRVEVGGVLDPDQMVAWQEIAREYQAARNGPPRLESVVRPREEPNRRTASHNKVKKVSVRGVVFGKGRPGLALLDNGAMVSEGDTIEGNYRVEKIEMNKVVLRNGAIREIHYVGEIDG